MPKLECPKICVVSIFLIASAITSAGQTFTTLVSFNLTNGFGPNAELVQGRDGNLYGTTSGGGSSNNCTDGCGTVFKVTPSGKLTTLHSFDGSDGSNPTGVVLGADGNFYGTTSNGGSSSNCSAGCGTVYKINPAGTLVSLHSFDGADGSGPYSSLIQGTDGNYYGTTGYGGTNTNCTNGCGTVFKISASGKLTVLHNFDGSDGSGPNAGLVQGANGTFYGTTFGGGTTSNGTAFEITAQGSFTTLHNFDGADGSGIYSGLIQGRDGNFYGTTEVGGGGNNDGTAFGMTPGGSVTTLHDFGGGADGINPTGLVLGSDGNFYGTAQVGGAHFFGTVFRMTAKGVVTTLHDFDSYDGEDPQCAPVQATNAQFYGTTHNEGPGGYGTLFSISTGLSPFVVLETRSGKVGAKVMILGMNLTGSTAVEFNGVNANTFSVHAGDILATVPAGATTGYVTVTTLGGSLKSSTKFDVIPQISSLAPTDGLVGTSVTLMGASLTQTTAVTFGGVKATSFSVISDTEVTVIVPTGAKTGKIAITTSGGSATSADSFSVTPHIASFTPSSGAAGTSVTVNGSGLTGVTKVEFHGVTASFTAVSGSKLTATVPIGATTGPISITTPGGTATSTTNFTVP
jgi:uncharacterized repeat protein (TIGR03803 family)